MPPQAYALFTVFLVCSILLGVLAARVAARFGGPRGRLAAVLPFLGGFGALYLVGHRLGVDVGPEISLFGYQVALIGDLAIGFVAALAVALVQAIAARIRSERSARRATTPGTGGAAPGTGGAAPGTGAST